VTCVQNLRTGGALMLGFVTGADQFGDVTFRVAVPGGAFVELAATCRLDGVPLAAGETVDAEELVLAFGRRADALLSAWAEVAGKRMRARVPETTPVGWCSWYYYYTGVTERAVLDNLAFAAKDRAALPFHAFQIDDGYQRAIGDWLATNEKFPSGMKAAADAIRAAGYVPGIWTAPFIAGPRSRLLTEHPDWFVKDARGRKVKAGINPLWKGFYYALDTTHPAVEAYVRSVYRALIAAGYGFFKIDFIYAAAMKGVRHDPTRTTAQVFRRAVEIVREEIGDAFLLGCGAPLLPCVGLVDAMRIGPDVAPVWGSETLRRVLRDKNSLSAVNAIRNTIGRAFMHRRLWINDPDCLMVRRNRSRLTGDEVRTLASVIAASGGMVLVSDDLAALDPDRAALIRRVVDLSGEGFAALDLMERPYPELLAAPRPWGVLLCVVNYGRVPVDRVIDLRRVLPRGDVARVRSIREVWTGRELRPRDGLIALGELPAHGAALLEIRTGEGA
jgi:alpha-galactosidase